MPTVAVLLRCIVNSSGYVALYDQYGCRQCERFEGSVTGDGGCICLWCYGGYKCRYVDYSWPRISVECLLKPTQKNCPNARSGAHLLNFLFLRNDWALKSTAPVSLFHIAIC